MKTLTEAEFLQKAAEICLSAHKGQTDRAGMPYFLHPFRIASQAMTAEEKAVGFLHDVVEDSPVTLADLRAEGFPETILEGVKAITRIEGETYEEYLEKVTANRLALRVKLLDLKDNADALRYEEMQERDLHLMNKYIKVYKRLAQL